MKGLLRTVMLLLGTVAAMIVACVWLAVRHAALADLLSDTGDRERCRPGALDRECG